MNLDLLLQAAAVPSPGGWKGSMGERMAAENRKRSASQSDEESPGLSLLSRSAPTEKGFDGAYGTERRRSDSCSTAGGENLLHATSKRNGRFLVSLKQPTAENTYARKSGGRHVSDDGVAGRADDDRDAAAAAARGGGGGGRRGEESFFFRPGTTGGDHTGGRPTGEPPSPSPPKKAKVTEEEEQNRRSVLVEGVPQPMSLEAPSRPLLYEDLINFPRSRGKAHARRCVMCGHLASGEAATCSIPLQNKDVCKRCDTGIWRHAATLEFFKWCKGCKKFLHVCAFAEKLSKCTTKYSKQPSKCDRCRERGRQSYMSKRLDTSRNSLHHLAATANDVAGELPSPNKPLLVSTSEDDDRDDSEEHSSLRDEDVAAATPVATL